MLKVETTIKRVRGTDHCKRGHNRWGYVRGAQRYCLDCECYRKAKRLFKQGIFGERTIIKFEEVLDFEIDTIKSQIEVLEAKIEKLEAEKNTIRTQYKSKLEKKAKEK